MHARSYNYRHASAPTPGVVSVVEREAAVLCVPVWVPPAQVMSRMLYSPLLGTTNVNLVASVFDDDPTRTVVVATFNIGAWLRSSVSARCSSIPPTPAPPPAPPPPAPPRPPPLLKACQNGVAVWDSFFWSVTPLPLFLPADEFFIDFDAKSPNVVARVTGE
jgi:hypothetical protein